MTRTNLMFSLLFTAARFASILLLTASLGLASGCGPRTAGSPSADVDLAWSSNATAAYLIPVGVWNQEGGQRVLEPVNRTRIKKFQLTGRSSQSVRRPAGTYVLAETTQDASTWKEITVASPIEAPGRQQFTLP